MSAHISNREFVDGSSAFQLLSKTNGHYAHSTITNHHNIFPSGSSMLNQAVSPTLSISLTILILFFLIY